MEADRRIVVTLPLVLEGEDTQTDPERLIELLRDELLGVVVDSRRRLGMEPRPVRIIETGEPLHYNDVRRGKPA